MYVFLVHIFLLTRFFEVSITLGHLIIVGYPDLHILPNYLEKFKASGEFRNGTKEHF